MVQLTLTPQNGESFPLMLKLKECRNIAHKEGEATQLVSFSEDLNSNDFILLSQWFSFKKDHKDRVSKTVLIGTLKSNEGVVTELGECVVSKVSGKNAAGSDRVFVSCQIICQTIN